MKIKAIAPWFGGKRTLAPRIVAELGQHSAYWEPFCGSMAVVFAKEPSHMETVNDLHGDLTNLARTLASDHWIDLQERLDRTLMNDGLFLEARDHVYAIDGPFAASVAEVASEHVDRAYWFFLVSWMGRNGVAGTSKSNITIATRYTSNGGSGGVRFRSAVESIESWHQRLLQVHIKSMDGIEMCGRIEDSKKSAMYVDPPYVQKGAKYVHDFSIEQHRGLAETLGRFHRTRVVVSYYDHPTIRELYNGWTFVACPVTKALVNQGKRDASGEKVHAPEVLIINGPSYTAPSASKGLFE